jgi:enoyl-CoA hydratase/carnithine racemase
MSILYSVDGAVGRITLNRPEKRNALNDELILALKDALALAAEDELVRVVLLSGAGQDFCSGADLAAFERTADDGVLDHLAPRANGGFILALSIIPSQLLPRFSGGPPADAD